MSLQTNHFYDFEDFRLDPAEKVLLHGGKPISITPKVFETLQLLVENAGRLIEKEELMRQIWQGRFVEESNLTFNIKMLRKALGDDANNPRFIENIPRRGYRFIADVREIITDNTPQNGKFTAQSFNLKTAESIIAEPVLKENSGETSSPETVSLFFSSIAKRPLFYLMAAILTGTCLLTGFFLFQKPPSVFERLRGNSGGKPDFLTVEKLTDTGNASGVNISPDGKMLIYFTVEGGKNTVWQRQFSTGISIPIFSANDENFHGIGFSRDGEFIYLSHQPKGEPMRLSRISIFGTAQVEIIRGFHGSHSFSPDNSQIAFVRLGDDGSTMMVADSDGKNERKLFTIERPQMIIAMDWSPDGKSIAYCAGDFHSQEKNLSISEFNLAERTEKPLTDFKWSYLETLMWLPDKSGLLIGGREKVDETNQIWIVSLSDGRAEQITNDSSSLHLSGASADFSRIVAGQSYLNTSIWIAPAENPVAARPVIKAQFDMSWTPDNKIVFPGKDTVKTNIWQTNIDGSEKIQLTANESQKRYAAASPDKRYVAFVSDQSGRQNVWRMDANGGNPTQLTNGEGEVHPIFTPDGKSILFNSASNESLWMIPVEGGTAKQILAEKSLRPAISSDGTKIAYFGRKDNRRKLLVKSFPEGNLLNEFSFISNYAIPPKLVWAKDGKSLIYYNMDMGFIGNLWRQSLAGGEPQKITDFTSAQIFDFDFSPDGKYLALVRGEWSYDAVLVKGFKFK